MDCASAYSSDCEAPASSVRVMSDMQPCRRRMIDAPGSKIGGITGGIVLAKMEIVRGNNPDGQEQPSGH
jgi:hypothetical protein